MVTPGQNRFPAGLVAGVLGCFGVGFVLSGLWRSPKGTPEAVQAPQPGTGVVQQTVPIPPPVVAPSAAHQKDAADQLAQKAKRLVREVDDDNLRMQALAARGDLTKEVASSEKKRLYAKADLAIRAANDALKLDPHNETAWLEKASALFLSDRYDLSLWVSQQALKQFPQNVDLVDIKEKSVRQLRTSRPRGA